MQYCNNCHVQIRGENEKCVLCGNTLLSGNLVNGQNEIFPRIQPTFERHMAIRIMVFVSFATAFASFVIRMIIPTYTDWPIFVLFGILSMWLSLVLIFRKRYDIPKTIMWQVTIASLLCVFWDWLTGWRGWSLDFVLPVLYIAVIFIMYITAKILKLSVRDYITYALIDCLLGIIPILFIIFDWVNNFYPSIICVTFSIIFLVAIFIFQGDNIKNELNKKMHI